MEFTTLSKIERDMKVQKDKEQKFKTKNLIIAILMISFSILTIIYFGLFLPGCAYNTLPTQPEDTITAYDSLPDGWEFNIKIQPIKNCTINISFNDSLQI